MPDTEYVVFAREKGVRLYGNYHTKRKYYISGVNQVDKKKWKHPTIKPLPFIENHIINSSNEGDLILDCFAGSGTTLVGAINQNRNFIGFEINNQYYEIAKQRIKEALEIVDESYSYILIAGGDGTVDVLLNEALETKAGDKK